MSKWCWLWAYFGRVAVAFLVKQLRLGRTCPFKVGSKLADFENTLIGSSRLRRFSTKQYCEKEIQLAENQSNLLRNV